MQGRQKAKKAIPTNKNLLSTIFGGRIRLLSAFFVVVLVLCGLTLHSQTSHVSTITTKDGTAVSKISHDKVKTDGIGETSSTILVAESKAEPLKEKNLSTTGSDDHYFSEPESYGDLKPRADGTFKVRTKPIRNRKLRERFSSDALQNVYLDHTRFEGASEAFKGTPCPSFSYSYKGFPGIGVCKREAIEDIKQIQTQRPGNCPTLAKTCVQEADMVPHEKWTPQVFVLHDVYVNVAGQIFNSTHFFDTNACTSTREQKFLHLPGRTRVQEFSELVTIVDWMGWNARTNMLDIIPAFVSLDAVMPSLKGIPVAFGNREGHDKNQLQQMQAIGVEDILGLELPTWNPHFLKNSQLFFAKKMFVPLHQRCGKPSRSMWQHIRYNHFLPRNGLPMYSPDWIPRIVAASVRPLKKSDDWVVLLGMKKEENPFVETLQLERKLLEYFPKDRVQVYYQSSIPMVRRKELLNRARLLVAVHGNVLADMVFMPPGGYILEIRPRDYPDPTFHYLADVCELNYYLALSEGRPAEGKRPSSMRIRNPRPIYQWMRGIAKNINRS